MLDKYPTAERIAGAQLASLEKIPHLGWRASPSGPSGRQAIRGFTPRRPSPRRWSAISSTQVRHMPAGPSNTCASCWSPPLPTCPPRRTARSSPSPASARPRPPSWSPRSWTSIGSPTPDHLVSYFGVFPEESSSGVDKRGKPLPPGTLVHVPQGQRPGPLLPLERRAKSPSSTTRPSAPSIAASGPKANAATSRWAIACASCSTWSTPSGRPIAPSTRTTSPGRAPVTHRRQRRFPPRATLAPRPLPTRKPWATNGTCPQKKWSPRPLPA